MATPQSIAHSEAVIATAADLPRNSRAVYRKLNITGRPMLATALAPGTDR